MEDKQARKIIVYIFAPFLIVSILSFKFEIIRTVLLLFFVFVVLLPLIPTQKKEKQNWKSKIKTLIVGLFILAGLKIKIIADLVLSYGAFFFGGITLLTLRNDNRESVKIYWAYFAGIGALIVTIIENRDILLKLLRKL